jgi:hypothetical protein
MYIKNRLNISEIKAFGSYQTLCLTERLGVDTTFSKTALPYLI